MGVSEDKRESTKVKRASKERKSSKVRKASSKKGGPRSFESTVELEELKNTIQEWVENTGEAKVQRNIVIACVVALIGFVSMFLGLFVVLIPGTYGAGGMLLYRNKGWRFFQPGIGGRRFVALNGVAWSLYAISLVIQMVNLGLHDPLLSFNSFMVGALSYCLMLGALYTYHPKSKRGGAVSVAVPEEEELQDESRYITPTFNDELQNSVLMTSQDSSPSTFWWIFIGMQTALTLTAFLVCIVGSVSKGSVVVRMLTTIFAMWTISGSVATTHALGGKWRHIRTNYAAFQPGKGGGKYIALQVVGWTLFSVGIVAGFIALAGQGMQLKGKKPLVPGMMAVVGVCGLLAQICIIASLFLYEDEVAVETNVKGFKKMIQEEEQTQNKFLRQITLLNFKLMNAIFGPPGWESKTRKPIQKDPDAHLECEAKWAEITKHCKRTGDRYLVVGNGFVGKRLVNRLLERGETDIRVFDIVENNHWKGDDRVKFIRGDVTKLSDIGPACEGVNTLYSTFAIIRFMDRLEHQAYLSYHINVTGTETLLEACKQHSVERLIVTSSSHATTDEDSEPRFNRDETAKLLTRKEAHNHYGWTKAIADKLSIEADGAPLANGKELKVTVVRPCSGVFGADDRLSFEKIMDMGIAPSLGATAVMDWVYVENVVLGHILAEQALQDDVEGVRGEAFCISNDDPVSMVDFWLLTTEHINLLPNKKMRKRLNVDFVWIPEAPLWAISYISEFNQWLFKGKVSLGRDLDTLTPPMLSTATMSYTYTSEKARKVLGYEPCFTLDEAIQRSLNEYYQNHYKN